MGSAYNAAVVIGPEGSGTFVFTDIVSKITGWERSDPSVRGLAQLEQHEVGRVYHVSLPSYRPEIWWDPGEYWPETTVIVGIVRKAIDSTFSAWRRFSRFPAGDPTVSHYWESHIRARRAAFEQSKLLVSYDDMCADPQPSLDKVCTLFQLPRISYGELGIELVSQNGKYLKSKRFMRELRELPGFKGVI